MSPGPQEMLHVPSGDLSFGHSTIMASQPQAFYDIDAFLLWLKYRKKIQPLTDMQMKEGEIY